MTIKKTTGRPTKEPSSTTFKDHPLHALLIESLPRPYVREGKEPGSKNLDTLRIATDLGISRFSVYRFLNEQKLSKKNATGLIRISGDAIEQSDLLSYLMRL